ncbi:unnamed protein product [Periconia digitata]|uniref:Flavin-containing monooxygenase n=1 Tax=Periconia digitata TaxID=1303443 RepID=A0A9W4UFX9_9PLEO|nr:unnamed protein product [Periconia digitata]
MNQAVNMKSVAVIGAGPAGIIAARKLSQSGKFQVHVFEKADEIGGSWAPGGIINPEMRTNQSKFTMSFSDFSWESIDQSGKAYPVYPQASQVFEYLQAYCKRYLSPDRLHLGTEVKSCELVPNSQQPGAKMCLWKLKLCKASVKNSVTKCWEEVFDYLVAAPGVYRVPNQWNMDINDLGSPARLPVMHSTRYRTLSELQHHEPLAAPGRKRVLVVGGSHSGAEVADLVARQLSDIKNAPELTENVRDVWKNTEVAHVSSHEMFGIPAVIRDSTASLCTFQPIDFKLFNRSSRPVEPPPSFSYGLVTPEKVTATRKLLHTIQDGNQGYLNGHQADHLAPVAVVGDLYTQFVKTGKIIQSRGTLETLSHQEGDCLVTAAVRDYTTRKVTFISNVCAIVYATGFNTASPFSIFDNETKTALEFDTACSVARIVLDCNFLTQNAQVPTFAFVGIKGAYWGLFEMQARAIVQAWTQGESEASESWAQNSVEDKKLREYYRDLRKAAKEGRKHEVPSNPFGDEVGAMEQASRELDLERFDLGFSESQGFVCPSRYLDPGSEKHEAIATLSEVQKVQREARDSGRFLARAVSLGLLGDWIAATRSTDGNGSMNFSQKSFGFRFPTDPSFTSEYLVDEIENGKLAARKVYRYSETTDRLSIWETRSDGISTGSLVATLDFNNATQARGKDTAVAVDIPAGGKASDSIEGLEVYRFHFAGSSLQMWTAGRADSTSPTLNFTRVGR